LAIIPKSICVPEGKEVTLFNLCGYNGVGVEFTENDSCINDNPVELL